MFGYCWIKEISKTWLHDFYNSVSPYKTGDLIIFLTFSIFIISPINPGFLFYFMMTLLHENTITNPVPREPRGKIVHDQGLVRGGKILRYSVLRWQRYSGLFQARSYWTLRWRSFSVSPLLVSALKKKKNKFIFMPLGDLKEIIIKPALGSTRNRWTER